MADVLVTGGKVVDGRIDQLAVQLHGLGDRTIDRDTALAWMKDGHSLVPLVGGRRAPALLLREVDDQLYIRADTHTTPADSLPGSLG